MLMLQWVQHDIILRAGLTRAVSLKLKILGGKNTALSRFLIGLARKRELKPI
jgi:hypothetical protein